MKGSIKIAIIIILLVILLVLFFYPQFLPQIQNKGKTIIINENNKHSFWGVLQKNFYRRSQESIKEIYSDPILHSIFEKDFFQRFLREGDRLKKLKEDLTLPGK